MRDPIEVKVLTHARTRHESIMRPTWHRIYYLLAAVTLLTLCVCLYLSHDLAGQYRESVKTNEEWSERLDRYGRLGSLAEDIDDDAHQVFESKDPKAARAGMRTVLELFDRASREAEREARASVSPEQAVPLLRELGDVDRAVRDVVSAAERVFSSFEQGRSEDAGGQLAAMDRAHGQINKELSDVISLIHGFQRQRFDQQLAYSWSIRQREYCIGAAIVALLVGIVFYGTRLSRLAAAASRELVQSCAILERNAERSRSLSAASPVGIVETDPEGRVIYANPKFLEMAGWSTSESRSREWIEALHPRDRRACHDEWRQAFGSGKEFSKELRLITPSGEVRWVLARAKSLGFARGALGGYVTTFEDLTSNRQRHDREIQQLQKMEAVGRLAGGVAHDFNNLLTVISGYTSMCLKRLNPEDPLHSDLEEVSRAAARAGSLTRQLLAFSRKQVIQPRTFSLNTLVHDMEKMLRRILGEDIELVTTLFPSLGLIKADPGQIEQVVMNLVVNARDAMPYGGKLVIETFVGAADPEPGESEPAAGPFMALRVRDTGTGMTPEVQAHLFEPFFTTKEKGKGTGLGLSTVYGITTGCGGRVRVQSELGKGTSFLLLFPEAAPEGAAELGGAKRSPTARGSGTILLVEDDDSVRQYSATALQAMGYRVLEAANPREALDLFRREGPSVDVMLTDVILPQMRGPELAAKISAQAPRIKVVYMSGYTDDAAVRDAFLSGEKAFVEKPFSAEVLASKIQEALRSPSTN